MLIPFAKMQAQGNDFAILELADTADCRLDLARLARDICDRRTGVGADGLVLLLADHQADARMLIYNSDGSRAAMCGSALRCCVSLLHGLKGKSELRVNTDSGIKAAKVCYTEESRTIEVNLGRPRLVRQELEVEGLKGCLVDIGNPHFITFWEDTAGLELKWGPVLENHAAFPGGVNSQFVRVISPGQIGLKIWERGAGATQACGTGAVASVFAGQLRTLLDERVTVQMPGGAVLIRRLENGEFILSGAVEHVFSGVYTWKI